jgi:hypothetical protein
MRTRNRCLLLVVFFLAVTSLTVRTAAARIVDPQPPPEAIDPGSPDDNGATGKHIQGGPLPSGGLSPITLRPAQSGVSQPPESDTREPSPARVPPAHGGGWLLEKILLLLLFR